MSERRDDFTIPAVHALHLAEVAQRLGVAPSALFAELALDEERLTKPDARLTVPQVEALVVRARELTRDDAIGVLLGLQMRISAHGYLGFAAMTASTVREALELAQRFAPTRTNAIGVALRVEGSRASIVLEERCDFGAARDAVFLGLAVGIWQIGNALTGRAMSGDAEFAFARPDYFDRFQRVAPRTRFAQPANRLVFDAGALDWPITLADPAAQRLARDQCERALDALGLDGDLLDRTRRLALKSDGGSRSLEEVAHDLRVSPRTLKRKLAAHRVTYSDVLDEQRREVALLLLRSDDASIDAIAERLGYSDAANFGRAFRRWTGVSPAAYRRDDATSGRRRSPA